MNTNKVSVSTIAARLLNHSGRVAILSGLCLMPILAMAGESEDLRKSAPPKRTKEDQVRDILNRVDDFYKGKTPSKPGNQDSKPADRKGR